jgi:hypothetical protein
MIKKQAIFPQLNVRAASSEFGFSRNFAAHPAGSDAAAK